MNATQNVAPLERLGSAAAGAALTALALHYRSARSLVLGAVAGELFYRALTGYCPVYGLFGVRTTAPEPHNANASVPYGSGVRVEQSISISRPAMELYDYWRKLETLPSFMQHVEEVTTLTDRRSRWRVRAPIGSRVTWEAEIINDIPGQLIGWRSLRGSAIHHAGSVHFDERDNMTQVRVVLEYAPPARYVGASVARVLGEERQKQIAEDLRRFKTIAERGEIPSHET
ncbi:MAG: DUF2892 domain-containing protein [Candidatus Eremiobacteraeota bacterium]|nr:DUF2892 domain-containing protein [Candidatus Eremiobacteraeota bacterium]